MRFIIFLVVLFLIIQIGILIFKNLIPNYRELIKDLNVRNEEMQRLETIKRLEKLFNTVANQREFTKFKEYKKYLEIYLPSKMKDYELLLILESILRRYGLTLGNVAFQEGSDINIDGLNVAGIKEINFTLGVAGNYSKIKNFIKEFENHSRVFIIKNLTINKSEEELTASFLLSTYFYQPINLIKEQ